MWALVESGSVTKVYSRPRSLTIGDVSYPQNIFTMWSSSELEALGIYAVEFNNTNYKDQETLTIDKITNDYGSPGKVLKIDELSIANRLSELENLTKGYYRWTDTTGLNQMSRNKEVPFNAIKFLEKSFKQIKKQKVA